MFELLPASFALGLWPLIALMATAQAFAGDRAAGTESFLLERPVPRARVWCARVLASSGTLFAVMVASGALAAAVAALTDAPSNLSWSRWFIIIASGMLAGMLAYVGA
jgi:ABC-type transport system involved in multi-copper enzyme maturation permease subunit